MLSLSDFTSLFSTEDELKRSKNYGKVVRRSEMGGKHVTNLGNHKVGLVGLREVEISIDQSNTDRDIGFRASGPRPPFSPMVWFQISAWGLAAIAFLKFFVRFS